MKYLIRINRIKDRIVDQAGLGDWTNVAGTLSTADLATGVTIVGDGRFGGNALKFTPKNYLRQSPSDVIGTDDFTFACWIKSLGVQSAYETIYATLDNTMLTFFTSDASTGGMSVSLQSYPYTRFFTNSSGKNIVAVKDTWNYYTVTRRGLTTYAFINGKLIDSSNSLPANIMYTQHNLGITELSSGNTPLNAIVDDIELIKGKALWAADFQVPTYYLDADIHSLFEQSPELFGMK